VFNELNQFCTVDLSSLYIDITKDRLYCDHPDSVRRRSSQTAIHRILDSLTRLLAPILVFTADEAWEHAGHADSVHLERFPEPENLQESDTLGVMDHILRCRTIVQRQIEDARQAKAIHRSDEARVKLVIPPESPIRRADIAPAELSEIFIVSEVEVVEGTNYAATVSPSPARKCDRCWRHDSTVEQNGSHPGLCERCNEVVESRSLTA
jgi:isoleucyl-tRNA synthetase